VPAYQPPPPNDAHEYGYGTPPSQSYDYGTPQTPGYGTPQTPGYGTPEAQGYGTPQTPGYGTSQTPGYGTPETHGYGTPQTPGYGTSQTPGYGTPETQGYGTPQAQGYGLPPAPGYDYGYPGSPYSYPNPPYAPGRPTDGMAIASLIVSCAGVLGLCIWGIGGLPGVVGAILGHVARRRIRTSGAGGAGLALAGIIVGWTITAIGAISLAAVIVLVVMDPSTY
jgi:hypothetical protein